MRLRRGTTRGRIALFLATFGMLVMSSGLVLIAAGSSATASAGPKECTEGTGWIEIDVNALTYTYDAPAGKVITDVCAKGPNAFPVVVIHLDPAMTSYTFNSVDFGWFNQNEQPQDISHVGIKLADQPVEPQVTTASVTAVQPTCANDNVASYLTSGEHIDHFSQSAEPAPGVTITVTAWTEDGWVFAGGATSKDFVLEFNTAESPCGPPEPQVTTASVIAVQPSCANDNVADYVTAGEHIDHFSQSAAPAPGVTITVTAWTEDGWVFDGGATSKDFVLEYNTAESPCTIVEPPTLLEPSFVDPTCLTEPQVIFPTAPDSSALMRATADPFASQLVGDYLYQAYGDLVPGGTVTVTATLAGSSDGPVKTWTHTFTVPTGCTVVSPPTVEPPQVTTPTVVASGLGGPTADLRSRDGVVLVLSGIAMMALAGGMVTTRRRRVI